MVRTISLGCVLYVFWLLLSGHYKPLLIVLGIMSCIGIVVLAHRMAVVDEEGHPIQFVLPALTYWPWLIGEIVKSSWDVARLIVDPALPISPTLVKVRASQQSRVAVATYANSITLTPGTIAVDVQGNDILVHALTKEGAEELAEGRMDESVRRFEGAE